MRLASPLLSIMLLTAQSVHGQQRPQIAGLFSNMGVGAESGDVGGVELFITYGRDGFYALFQMAEGIPDVPVLVKLEVRDSTVTFTFPADSRYHEGLRTFTGTVAGNGLTGKFANGYSVRLVRLKCDGP